MRSSKPLGSASRNRSRSSTKICTTAGLAGPAALLELADASASRAAAASAACGVSASEKTSSSSSSNSVSPPSLEISIVSSGATAGGAAAGSAGSGLRGPRRPLVKLPSLRSLASGVGAERILLGLRERDLTSWSSCAGGSACRAADCSAGGSGGRSAGCSASGLASKPRSSPTSSGGHLRSIASTKTFPSSVSRNSWPRTAP
mmetsp:Transcript_31579/g.79740  ORF Transcript_31579/g.79740 Transcript_31579/m.79740 type:complete len:203 (-) Transcript_31579:551-1159(-)